MRHREKRFESKFKPSKLLKFMSMLLFIVVVLLWIFRKKLGIDIPDMLILTGIILFIINLSIINRRKNRRINVSDELLKKNRDSIGKNNYNNDVFFDK